LFSLLKKLFSKKVSSGNLPSKTSLDSPLSVNKKLNLSSKSTVVKSTLKLTNPSIQTSTSNALSQTESTSGEQSLPNSQIEEHHEPQSKEVLSVENIETDLHQETPENPRAIPSESNSPTSQNAGTPSIPTVDSHSGNILEPKPSFIEEDISEISANSSEADISSGSNPSPLGVPNIDSPSDVSSIINDLPSGIRQIDSELDSFSKSSNFNVESSPYDQPPVISDTISESTRDTQPPNKSTMESTIIKYCPASGMPRRGEVMQKVIVEGEEIDVSSKGYYFDRGELIRILQNKPNFLSNLISKLTGRGFTTDRVLDKAVDDILSASSSQNRVVALQDELQALSKQKANLHPSEQSWADLDLKEQKVRAQLNDLGTQM
jgi:hypothetical protein